MEREEHSETNSKESSEGSWMKLDIQADPQHSPYSHYYSNYTEDYLKPPTTSTDVTVERFCQPTPNSYVFTGDVSYVCPDCQRRCQSEGKKDLELTDEGVPGTPESPESFSLEECVVRSALSVEADGAGALLNHDDAFWRASASEESVGADDKPGPASCHRVAGSRPVLPEYIISCED